MISKKKCILCGCKDHKLLGCSRHFTKRCSCYQNQIKKKNSHLCLGPDLS